MKVETCHNKKWFALYVNVRHEKTISLKLAEMGIESYVPVTKQLRQWSDRKKMIESPLISGYVFVNIAETDMDKPRFVPGVVNYVRFQGKPAIIRDAAIEGLKYFVNSGYVIESGSEEEVRIGDSVRFAVADFKDFTAHVESLEGNNYAIVTLDDVHMNFKIKAPLKALVRK